MPKINQLGNATDVTGQLHPTHQRDDIEEEEQPSAQTNSSASTETHDASGSTGKRSGRKPARTTERR